jgi:hypothetical protein
MYDPLVVDVFVEVKDALAASYLKSVGVDAEPTVPHRDRALGKLESPMVRNPQLNPDFATALRTILTSLGNDLNAALVVAFIKDISRDEIFVGDAVGEEAGYVSGVRFAVGSRVSGWVVANSRRVANADARLEFDSLFQDGRLCLSVPVQLGASTVAAITLVSQPNQQFDEATCGFVDRVAKSFDEPPLRDLLAREIAPRPSVPPASQLTVH